MAASASSSRASTPRAAGRSSPPRATRSRRRKIAAAHPNVQLEALDVADPASITALAAKLKGRTIDVLLHNAGISGGVPNQIFGRMNYAAFRDTLEVNAVGPLESAVEALIANVQASAHGKVISARDERGVVRAHRCGASLLVPRQQGRRAHADAEPRLRAQAARIAVGVVNPGPVDTDMMKGVRMPLQPPAVAVGKVVGIIDRLDVAHTGRLLGLPGRRAAW
ncbi:MAG: SDR family NAD(P)-dependent oxidoreductase [Steroidobacteraceae bacterium]